MSDRLSILIAEDSPADRMLLSTIVSREGHRVLTASNGLEALALYEQERPQLVLMDALMPVMDGFEAASRIKALAGDLLVPIIFLTSLTDNEALVRCLDVGDDVLVKPYNRIVLQAKIRAMDRLRRLQQTVLEQRDLIARHNEHLLNEQRVAKGVFDKVAHSGCLSAANIRYLQSPFALFNGDLMLAAYKPSGGMHVLLGDFTGHGLPAAIGAMPLAEVFYGMTAKGFPMAEILREMNAKLKRILPVGVFCCATMLNLSFQRRLVEVWSGGLPDGYLLRASGRVPLVSRHLPFGVLDAPAFNDACEVYPLETGERIFLLSDGVLETPDRRGQMFGEARLLQVLENGGLDEVQRALAEFRDEAQDDVSMIEVSMLDEAHLRPPLMFTDTGHSGPLDWSARFEFRAESLKRSNPLPFLIQLLMEVQGLRPSAGALYSVLTELYSNALEHGVLGLDSALKAGPQGFLDYYRERSLRLQQLSEGHVRFDFELSQLAKGGMLCVHIEDSGAGFDVAAVLARAQADDCLSGRGLLLVQQLCHECHWTEDGRGVDVVFRWSAHA